MKSSIRVGMASLGIMLSATMAQGSLISLTATHDATAPNAFTLDFGQFGGETTAQISNTDFVLNIDAEKGSASFVSYAQTIQSIMLPNNIPTGLISVTIVPGSSSGTYDSVAGTFTTSELYSIVTENDLSAFGLTNPVILPSSSNGVIDFAKSKIAQNWAGSGQIGIPPDVIPFDYTCTVNTTFTPEPSALAMLGLGMAGIVARRRR